MIATTLSSIEGLRGCHGVATHQTIIFRDQFAGLGDVAGARSGVHEPALTEARETAHEVINNMLLASVPDTSVTVE